MLAGGYRALATNAQTRISEASSTLKASSSSERYVALQLEHAAEVNHVEAVVADADPLAVSLFDVPVSLTTSTDQQPSDVLDSDQRGQEERSRVSGRDGVDACRRSCCTLLLHR